MRPVVLVTLLCACGGGLSSASVTTLTDSTNDELQVEAIVGDGGTCVAAQVRALERAAYCGNASVLHELGRPVPDGGILCSH
jgi:hypothetical protein